jgi:hypothetical protein
MDTDKITYQLESTSDKETSLKNIANDVLNQLRSKFGHEYTITANEFGLFDKDWSHVIKIRKGNKIGAEVGFKWEKSQPEMMIMEVDESSKLGSLITYGILLPFIAVGAYMAYNDIEPLAFLPGHKIAGGLGGLIAMIPGLIIVSVVKSMLLKNEKTQNAQLVYDIKQLISK